MNKTLDLTKTVYDLCASDSDMIRIMQSLGFEQIANPVLLNTAGRIMTIPRGAKAKGIDMDVIIDTFEREGYHVIGKEGIRNE
ncbi:DUF1858 domain-containing protein [Paenibacillus melissococcoides]|uniref:DUF1858 domain-containing protein n=1 Tax=Paenibacillus melissococcoides TaxID=2912268 RepID=A0ABM9G9Z6_9BACL|nr:DUF1858 domain-containing protein [Paenibacillus melissococcoides]MEB9894638.1 DUF1858 domain-containing protein [Bacillus cereus]CAH8248900.1 DUF1858 domain-containing protein [Paenibacillus melissococcoides]CAH8720732.1 DUF1858 domain-containing protein [Paenibacillus melissococcoides]CAH8720915.1 DUF1858 domain-containing protein [Paenibacillus melissococcoides]